MGRLMISSSQMCISREQEEFLAAYRTDEARQAFIDSYGKEKVNFLNSDFDGDNSLPVGVVPLELLAFNGSFDYGIYPQLSNDNVVYFNAPIADFSFSRFSLTFVGGGGISIYQNNTSIRRMGHRIFFSYEGSLLGRNLLLFEIYSSTIKLYTLHFRANVSTLLPESLVKII